MKAILILGLLGLLVACSNGDDPAPVPEPEPLPPVGHNGDPQFSPPELRVGFRDAGATGFVEIDLPVGRPTRVWEQWLPAPSAAAALPLGERIAGFSLDGTVVLIDRASGRIVESVELPVPVVTTPWVVGSAVYLPGGDFGLGKLDLDSGERIWEAVLSHPAAGPVFATTGRVYSATTDGSVAALDAADGALLWTRKIADRVTTPAVSAGRLIVGTEAGSLVALDPDSGGVLWTSSPIDRSFRFVSARDNLAVGLATDGLMAGINAESGVRLWFADLGRDAVVPPVLAADRVYLAGLDGWVEAFDLETGGSLWRAQVPGGISSPPAASSTMLLLVSDDGRLFALSAEDGAGLWEYPLGMYADGGPVLHDGSIFLALRNGRVLRLDPTETPAASYRIIEPSEELFELTEGRGPYRLRVPEDGVYELRFPRHDAAPFEARIVLDGRLVASNAGKFGLDPRIRVELFAGRDYLLEVVEDGVPSGGADDSGVRVLRYQAVDGS